MLRIRLNRRIDTRVLASRMEAATAQVADIVARKIAEIVRSKLPTGGWFDIYRAAIGYFVEADGKRWAIAGLWPAKFETFPAETTLVTLEGDDPIAKVIEQRNPWPIDMLPAISGGYRMTATARPSSTTDVESRRAALRGALTTITDALTDAGATVLPNEFPLVNGKVYADIAFMARALEHGLAGLPRLPVWLTTFRDAVVSDNSMRAWIEAHHATIQAVLDGSEPNLTAGPMPSDL